MSWINDEIVARGGAVSFRDYMELALYHPAHGYYAQPTPRYGRSGDFLTAPTASPWYARALARALASSAARLGRVHLIEPASGDGGLLVELIRALGQRCPEVLERITSIERSEAMRQTQAERLTQELGATSGIALELVDSVAGLKAADSARPTVIHASELYDALPVHRVRAANRGTERPELLELWVDASGGSLEWVERPAPAGLVAYLEQHGVTLQAGQLAEINLEAARLHRRLLDAAGEIGICLVLDYGYEARRLYNPRGRLGGSLACYREHQLERDPLARPGMQDITAHVNWDDLASAARAAGWLRVGLWPLAELLIRGGLADEVASLGLGMEAELDADTICERQELKRLLDPEGMGSDLKALVQATPRAHEAAGAAWSCGPDAR